MDGAIFIPLLILLFLKQPSLSMVCLVRAASLLRFSFVTDLLDFVSVFLRPFSGYW